MDSHGKIQLVGSKEPNGYWAQLTATAIYSRTVLCCDSFETAQLHQPSGYSLRDSIGCINDRVLPLINLVQQDNMSGP